ncbi:sulfite exporter TauE/SafE family protein [Clostridiaceae bacterium HSG29]|nr:sulfite exporter TauE/SafE family protein [Clostridiaceae bacterium HSG29]
MIYLLLIIVGVFAGFINVMAGGGSLLTLPMLIFMGLPSQVANGTNRLAILIEASVGANNFKSKGYFELKKGIYFALPAVFGAIIGSNIAINLSESVFNRLLAVVLVMMLLIIIFQPHKKIKTLKSIGNNNIFLGSILFFFVGLYGGVIQAGVGFLIITVLSLITNYKLVKINSLKILIVLIYTIPAFLIFAKSGNVDYIKGLVLAIGNSTGAYLGSNLQIKKGDKIVKVFLTIAIIVMVMKLLGFFG